MVRLRSMEAVRYGSLENLRMGEFGDGLTVVLGPNEAGKSTLTAMTRHVLYGYPRANAVEPGYTPPAGDRHGRLVFADTSGEWAVDRIGSKMGVTTLKGADRSDLVESLVTGVSDSSYRIVFGFGLDELKQIASSKDSADVINHLRASAAGLGTNPLDVRKRLDMAAGEIFAPGSRVQTRKLHAVAKEIKELQKAIKRLEAEAADLAAEQAEYQRLSTELQPLRDRLTLMESQAQSLIADLHLVKAARERIEELELQRAKTTAAANEVQQSIGFLDIDEKMIAAGPQLLAVLDQMSAFSTRLESAQTSQRQADAVQAEIEATGLPDGLVDSAQARATVEETSVQLAALRRRVEDTAQAATTARARANQAAISAQEQPAGAAPAKPVVATAALGLLGVLAIAAGAASAQWLAVGFGAAALIIAAVLFLRPAAPVAQPAVSDDARRAETDARTAEEVAEKAARELEDHTAKWRQWLVDERLDFAGDSPAAVRDLLERLAERDRKKADHGRLVAAAQRDFGAAEEWVTALTAITAQIDPAATQLPAVTGAVEFATRVRQKYDAACQAALERKELLRVLSGHQAALAQMDEELVGQAERIELAARRHAIAPEEAAARLEALVTAAADERTELREQCEAAASDVARMKERLNEQARNDELVRHKQQLEGKLAQATALADEYLELRIAADLLGRTYARYERERQSGVVNVASAVFAQMTDGLYTQIIMSLESDGIRVVTDSGAQRDVSLLSRGAQEQLYLALRVALIESLQDKGRDLPVLMDDVVVNFDPGRRAGAASAIARLAQSRQVIFFTCCPETVDVLTDASDSITMLTMDRCRPFA